MTPGTMLKGIQLLTAGALMGCLTEEDSKPIWSMEVPAWTESEDGVRSSWAFWITQDDYEGVLFQAMPGPKGNVDSTFPSSIDMSSCTVGMSGKLKITSGDLTLTVDPVVDTGWVIPGMDGYDCVDDNWSGCPSVFVAVETEGVSGGKKELQELTALISCPIDE